MKKILFIVGYSIIHQKIEMWQHLNQFPLTFVLQTNLLFLTDPDLDLVGYDLILIQLGSPYGWNIETFLDLRRMTPTHIPLLGLSLHDFSASIRGDDDYLSIMRFDKTFTGFDEAFGQELRRLKIIV